MTECYFCRGKVLQRKVKVDFRWGGKLKVIENVPTGVCRQCGEKYFHSDVYKLMEKLAVSRVRAANRMEDVARITCDLSLS